LLWHSARLAKKAFHHALAVAVAQNVLMKKLDLLREGQLEAVDFEKYANLFNDGLTEGHTQLILELIHCSKVTPTELSEVE
jgi:hypothetical protein